jgi:hypothetical protein
VVATAQDASPTALIVDGGLVFWAVQSGAAGGGGILSAPLDGSAKPAIKVGGLGKLIDLQLTADAIFWSDQTAVWSAMRTGSPPRQIGSGLTAPWRLRVYGTSLYFADLTGLWQVPVDGSTQPSRIAGVPNTILDVAVDGGGVYWVGGSPPSYADGALYRADVTGSHVTRLAGSLAYPALLALETSDLFWLGDGSDGGSFADGTIYKISRP